MCGGTQLRYVNKSTDKGIWRSLNKEEILYNCCLPESTWQHKAHWVELVTVCWTILKAGWLHKFFKFVFKYASQVELQTDSWMSRQQILLLSWEKERNKGEPCLNLCVSLSYIRMHVSSKAGWTPLAIFQFGCYGIFSVFTYLFLAFYRRTLEREVKPSSRSQCRILPQNNQFLVPSHSNYTFLKKEGKLGGNLHTKVEEKPVSGDTQMIISTHLDHGKKFVGDLLEVVAGDDATARPLAQVTGAVFSQLSCSPIRT